MGTFLMWDATTLVDSMASKSIFLTHVRHQHTVTVEITDANGSVSALLIDLEASDDGRGVTDANAKWYSLNTHTFNGSELTALRAMWHVVSKPVKRVRLKVDTSTGESSGDALKGRYTEGSE